VKPSLILVHSIVGRAEVSLEFDPDRPWRACMLCGKIYQRVVDRLPMDQITPLMMVESAVARQKWANQHSKTHTQREHDMLAMSGRTCTPEAARTLAPYGIAPVSDMVFSPEHRDAAASAPRLPSVDSEN
jgi:hypothetical protein